LLTLTKLNNFNCDNCLVLIVNFCNHFDKALTKKSLFCRALACILRIEWEKITNFKGKHVWSNTHAYTCEWSVIKKLYLSLCSGHLQSHGTKMNSQKTKSVKWSKWQKSTKSWNIYELWQSMQNSWNYRVAKQNMKNILNIIYCYT